MTKPSADRPQRFIYGRRQAPQMKASHKELLQGLLPKLAVSLPGDIKPSALSELGLDGLGPLWLEIGFGGGEHLAATAADNPDKIVIGVEPYITGVAKLLAEINRQSLQNVRILMDDARLLLRSLPDDCLERAFILYPDPWPKLRHNKRRIINSETLKELLRILQQGAELRIATDHADYRRWILAAMRQQPEFIWQAMSKTDWENRPPDQMSTRYEEKALKAGRTPVYLRYVVNK